MPHMYISMPFKVFKLLSSRKREASVISQLLGILESNREAENLGEFDRPAMEML